MNTTPPLFVTHRPIDLLREILQHYDKDVEVILLNERGFELAPEVEDLIARVRQCLDQHEAMKAALSKFTIEHKINIGTPPASWGAVMPFDQTLEQQQQWADDHLTKEEEKP